MEKQSKNQSSNTRDSENTTELQGYGLIQKTVKGHKTGIGYIYLPADWIGHDIAVISLTPFLDEKTDEK